jgi:hypothetical protein
MKIDYIEMARLVDIRKKQIEDASLEYEYFNKEYVELEKIRKSLTELILLERNDPKEYEEKK